jgi:hypothetical protein
MRVCVSKARELREQAAVAVAESGRLAQEAAASEAGGKGEWRVTSALSRLVDARNLLVLHDRLLRPGRSQANLDHVVSTGQFLLSLDTGGRTWSTRRTGQGTSPSTEDRCAGASLTARDDATAGAWMPGRRRMPHGRP